MALSSRSKHLVALLGSLLFVALPPRLVRAQRVIQLSDSMLAATDELPVRLGNQTSGMWRYRFGEFFVLSREGGTVHEGGRTRGPILDRRAVARGRQSYRYAVKGRGDSTRVSVSVRWFGRTEVKRPFVIGARIEGPEDTVEVLDSTSALVVFEEDTAAAWTVTMVERSGTAVTDGYAFVGTITSSLRAIRLVPVKSAPVPRRRGLRGLIANDVAYGFVLEEEGLAIAAVQFWGTGTSGLTDQRVWMPRAVTARERIEFAAIFTAVLAAAGIPSSSPQSLDP